MRHSVSHQRRAKWRPSVAVSSEIATIGSIVVAGTILGIAGTDLVLPAVPTLPEYITGTLNQAQLVLAAFAGAAIWLLVFGELG